MTTSGCNVARGLALALLAMLAVLAPAARAADPPSEALALTAAENPSGLKPLPAPLPGRPLFARRPDGFLPAGLDIETSTARLVDTRAVTDQLAAGHLNFVRMAGTWAYVEPEPGTWSFKIIDAQYRAVIKSGLRPVIQLIASPSWAVGYKGFGRDDGCNGAYCNQAPGSAHYDEWGKFAGAMARRYPLAAAIEVWNEPNLWGFWHAGGVDPAAYAHLLAAAYDGIKRANPAMRVLGGALNNIYNAHKQTQADCNDRGDKGIGVVQDCMTKYDSGYSDFLRGMLAAGAAQKMDGLSFHPYPIDKGGSGLINNLNETQRVLGDAGAASMRLVPSELGVNSPSSAFPDDQAQAAATVALYEALNGSPTSIIAPAVSNVDAVLFFESVEIGEGFGWLHQGSSGALSPRPVFCAMADRLGKRPSECPGAEQFADPVVIVKKPARKKASKRCKKVTSKKTHKKVTVCKKKTVRKKTTRK